MPVVRRPVLRRVLAHGRDDDPVPQLEFPEPERGEEGGRSRAGRDAPGGRSSGPRRRIRRGPLREPAVDERGEVGVAQREVGVGDPEAARDEVEGELHGFRLQETLRALEPFETRLGRPLHALDLGPAGRLVGRQRGSDGKIVGEERLVKRDRVDHREPGARPDGEVGRVRGVADEHDVAVAPRPVPDGREAPPDRPVRDESMGVQFLPEGVLEEGDGLLFGRGVHAGGAPRRLGRLDDEGGDGLLPGAAGPVLIRVHAPQTVFGLPKIKREGGEGLRRAEPHEPVRTEIDAGAERAGVSVPHAAVHAIGGEHEIGVGVRLLRLDFHAAPQIDAEGARSRLQDLEEGGAGEAAEPVSGRCEPAAPVVDVDVVPMVEGPRDRLVALTVRGGEFLQRGVGEHDAESVGVAGAVALEDDDVVRRTRALHQDREVQAGRPASDTDDPQGSPSSRAASNR